MELMLEGLGIVHHAVVLDHDAFRTARGARGVEYVGHAVGNRPVGLRFRGGKVAAVIIGDDEPDTGGTHHVVDTLAGERGLGGNIGRAALQNGEHGCNHLDAVAHHDPDGRVSLGIELRHDGVCHDIEVAVRYRASVLDHGVGVRLDGRQTGESAVYSL